MNGNEETIFKCAEADDGLFEYLYRALVQSTDDYLYICNMRTGIFRYCPEQVAAFALPGEIVKNPMPYWEKIVHPDDWERFYKANIELGVEGNDTHSVEFRVRQRDGNYVWLRCRGQLMRDRQGEPVLFAGIMKRMGWQHKVDQVTQLLNRQVFVQRMQEGILDKSIEHLAVAVLDLDNFRQINETYGREIGDKILLTLSWIIQAQLPDNVGLYRLENDNMGLLMGNSTAEEVQEVVQKIRKAVSEQKMWKVHGLKIEFSVGCAFYPKDGETTEELYQYAEFAMQHAKDTGKNRLEFFSGEILRKKSRMLGLVKKMQDSINNGFQGFYVNYQPQIDSVTCRMTGVEALLRFRDTDGSLISPAEFIPVLEMHGMIYKVGVWVLKEAVREGKKWISLRPEFTVSVNVSTIQIQEEQFFSDLIRVLEKEGFPGKNLIIEMTESCIVQNMEVFEEKLKLLKTLGIRVAMDDFGTGYSSLGILKKAPVDIVKIDRSFVENILDSHFDATFVSLVVELCHLANIRVCQEGAETAAEYDFLKKMKLDSIQGYYFGRPSEPEVITERLIY